MTAHTVSVQIAATADQIFAYISNPATMDRWSFGTWKTVVHEDGLIEGRALATGALTFVRIVTKPDRFLVDYHLGETADRLLPRIFARIIPGEVTGHDPDTATLMLTALRTAGMDQLRWERLCRAHGAELDLIKGQIETGHDPTR